MNPVRTILYVEDDPVVRTVYENCLKRAGYHVIPASDGLEAMKRLAAFVPDLVLLDLMLPRFNGEEVFLFIRTNPLLVKVPVILLSSNSIMDAAQEHLLETASKRLIKDHCNPATLLAAVKEVLNGAPAETKPDSDRPVSFSALLHAATA